MNLSKHELTAKLVQTIQGLNFMSETDAPFKPFYWQPANSEDLTIENLLKTINFLSLVEVSEFLGFVADEANYSPQQRNFPKVAQETASKCQEMLKLLHTHLVDIQIYQISPTSQHPFQELFHIIIGCTDNGDWLGIAPTLSTNPNDRRSEQLEERDLPSPQEETLNLKQKLTEELAEILATIEWPTTYKVLSSNQKPKFIIESTSTRDLIIDKLLDSLAFVKTCQFSGFSEATYYENKAENEERKLEDLEQLLKTELTDLREYVIGNTGEFHLYNIGQTKDGNWAGVSTSVIWT